MKRIIGLLLTLPLVFGLFFGMSVFAEKVEATDEVAAIADSSGEQGYLVYEISNGQVTITDCDEFFSGEMIIPETIEGYPVTAIGEDTFHSAYLTSVTIPKSVTAIGSGAFCNCWYLTGIWVDEENPNFSNDGNGFLFNKDKTALLCALDSLTGSYTIPDSVTVIADSAFASCNKLTAVTIPDGVITIGDHAFANCDNLTTVTIGNGVTTIGYGAYRYCESLKSVSIPEGVTSIGGSAFYQCGSLTSVTIPDSVTAIGDSAFYWCDALTSIAIPGSVCTIGNSAFAVCESLKCVTLGKGVKTLGENAFQQCRSLTSVVVPDTVTSIGAYAFDYCESLRSITLPKGLKTVETCVLSRTAITSVVIPNGVTIIDRDAITECTKLTTVTIPKTVTSIGVYAFSNCDALEAVYYGGTATQWAEIDIPGYWGNGYNEALYNATLYFKENGDITQPANVEITAGFVAEFTVEAANAASYKWQYRRNENAPWVNTTLTGYAKETLQVPALLVRNGYQYRCRVTDTNGKILYSDPATLTVLDSITITEQPMRQIVNVDTNATFAVKAEGEGLTYQWLYRKNDEDFWKQTGLTGNKTDTLTVPALLSRNGYQYLCAVTDENGIKIQTKVAVLSAIGFTDHPADQTVGAGGNAVFKVTAKGQNLTYQWQYRKSETGSWMSTSLSGYNTNALTVQATTGRNGYQYRCRITDTLGTIVYSDAATLRIGITVTAQPTDQTVAVNTNAVFTVAVTGTDLTYQWQYCRPSGSWLNTSLTGATTAKLTVEALSGRNGYQYRCVITDANGNTVTTDPATLYIE